MIEYLGKLFKAPVVDCLEEGAFLDPLGGSNTLLGKVILIQRLEKFASGRELFQVIKDQGFELIIKSHLQRAVPPGFKCVILLESLKNRGKKQFESTCFS